MFPEWVCKSDQNAVTENRIHARSRIDSIVVKLEVMALTTRASSSPNSRIRYYVLHFSKVGFFGFGHSDSTFQHSILVHVMSRCVDLSGRRQAEISGEREARHEQTESIEGY